MRPGEGLDPGLISSPSSRERYSGTGVKRGPGGAEVCVGGPSGGPCYLLDNTQTNPKGV